MEKTTAVDWGGHHVKLTWLPSTTLPDLKYVTSVHGVCILDGKVLLARVASRGFNLPGGHIEEGETPEETLIRECMEEGYVKCDSISFLGMIRVSHEENPLFDPNGKYPLIGYQLFYRTRVVEYLPYKRENECLARIWVEPEEIPYVIDDHELSHLIVNEAFKS
ncbi:NUDIX domain-containing protein [Paenibacillus sp. GCM10027626]|uniref:NUDIX hydrolase n=1 Tax=Paenibacillus sp. GCM10027626 TaxID=3273411 RepID=UPI003643BC73